MNKIYLIPTPIGNLDDITIRSLKKFKEINIFFCEDTRVTKKLFNLLDISLDGKKFISNHKFNEKERVPIVFDYLQNEDIAIVSDAGSPTINDPGGFIIREAIKKQIEVIPLSGPSSLINTLMGAGIDLTGILFLGFCPKTETSFLKLINSHRDQVEKFFFFLSVHQFTKILQIIDHSFPNHYLVVAKELTKQHEKFFYGVAKEIIKSNPNPKGEYCMILVLENNEEDVLKNLENEIIWMKEQKYSNKEIIEKLTNKYPKVKKNSIYNITKKI